MFVVSFPYAILHGGWWGVVALVGVAYICYHTGIMLVQCLYDEKVRSVCDDLIVDAFYRANASSTRTERWLRLSGVLCWAGDWC